MGYKGNCEPVHLFALSAPQPKPSLGKSAESRYPGTLLSVSVEYTDLQGRIAGLLPNRSICGVEALLNGLVIAPHRTAPHHTPI